MKEYIIKIKIDNEEELYNKFDKNKNTLSDEFISYIHDKIELSETNNRIVFEVDCKKDIDENQLNNTFKKHINDQLYLLEKKIKRNSLKEFSLVFVGLLLLVISIYFGKQFKSVTIEFFSIISWFALWEAADSRLLANKDLKERRYKLLNLLKTKVIETNKKS